MSLDPPTYIPNDLLGRLVGARLFSVQFVHDYVQLRFDGLGEDMPILNCDAMPTVETAGGQVFSDGDLGYADALRALIPDLVQRTCEATGTGLRLEFPTGAIALHPDREALTGPEIALLTGFEDQAWMCWRPGEESFEDLA
ncbi:hypothetical protein [Nocardioides daejeonensis]|uniref:hypothetical protein n=1 Tax=Nocardioides daejeonensis TaxID=1046556 RepID=UPI000D7425EE|nr:hypothetical protein [Nocardioides daejeonensis]